MSQEHSRSAKERWSWCEELGDRLGRDKRFVYNRLYARLKREGLAMKVLNGDEIMAVRSWPEFQEPEPATASIDNDMAEGDAYDRLNIARWFVNKVGGIAKAEAALAILRRAKEELS